MARVLVVDDEADICELVRVNLELDGHEVVTALGGEEALGRVADARPDLILLDVMMPGMDGWTVLARLKGSEPAVATIPVLMLTARTAQEDRIRGGIEGAIRYITKPFSPAELRDEVRAALAGEPEPVRRRRVQEQSLEQLARLEKGQAAAASPTPRPRLTRLERPPESPAEPAAVREARQRTANLSAKQQALLHTLRDTRSVSEAAALLGVSRSNIYASLRRIGRKLGTHSVPELLALVRRGDLPLDQSTAG